MAPRRLCQLATMHRLTATLCIASSSRGLSWTSYVWPRGDRSTVSGLAGVTRALRWLHQPGWSLWRLFRPHAAAGLTLRRATTWGGRFCSCTDWLASRTFAFSFERVSHSSRKIFTGRIDVLLRQSLRLIRLWVLLRFSPTQFRLPPRPWMAAAVSKIFRMS